MTENLNRHLKLTKARNRAFEALFGQKAESVFPFHTFSNEPEPYLIDVMIYPIKVANSPGPIVAAVTNGMSDHLMKDPDSGKTARSELIQYFRACDEPHACRLYELAWLPLFDKFLLDEFHTVTWPTPVVPGSPLKNSLVLTPIWPAHRSTRTKIEGEARDAPLACPDLRRRDRVQEASRDGRFARPHGCREAPVDLRRVEPAPAGPLGGCPRINPD